MTWELELPEGFIPRECQPTAVAEIEKQWERGLNSTLLVFPTGTGKTYTAAMVIQKAVHDHGWRSLFLTHRRDLVRDAYDVFLSFGLIAAIDMANLQEQEQAAAIGEPEVVVATKQTLSGHRLLEKASDRFDLIIIDEAHRSLSLGYDDILGHFEGYKLVGLTATPDGAKRNLGNRFESLAYRLKLKTAIERGWLSRIVRRTIKTDVDLRSLRHTKSDFNEAELAERILPAVEGLAYNIKLNIGNRQTVVFCPDLRSCSGMAEMLRKLDIKAKYIAGSQGDYGMAEDERDAINRMFKANRFQVIVSNELICEGWDCPQVSCVVNCCPTTQRWKYVQRAGRGFRTCAGKENFLFIDFDWLTDESVKRLCTPVTLFADSFDEDVAERAGRKAKDTPEGDLLDEMDFAEEEEKQGRRSKEMRINYTGKFSRQWETVDDDPVGIARVIGEPVSDFQPRYKDTMGGPATEPQIWKLHALGINNAAGMSKWGASKLISKLEKRRQEGKGSWQQVKRLLAAGVDEKQARELPAKEAAKVIASEILKQGELFE